MAKEKCKEKLKETTTKRSDIYSIGKYIYNETKGGIVFLLEMRQRQL